MVGWKDLEGLVEALRTANPRVDPRGLDDAELSALVERLDGFEAGGPAPGPGDLEALRAIWHWGG